MSKSLLFLPILNTNNLHEKNFRKFSQTLLFSMLIIFANAQNKETTAKVESIKNDYILENGNIVYQKIFEFPGKSNSDLFDSGVDFLENYTNSQIKVSSSDAARGKIKAWGFFKDFSKEKSWGMDMTISASYNVSIDIKDEKIKLRITLADYFEKKDGTGLSNALSNLAGSTKNIDLASALAKTSVDVAGVVEGDFKVINSYPFNLNGDQKNIYGRTFYLLNNHIKTIFPDFQKYVKDSVTEKW